jgi:hypothetical protein
MVMMLMRSTNAHHKPGTTPQLCVQHLELYVLPLKQMTFSTTRLLRKSTQRNTMGGWVTVACVVCDVVWVVMVLVVVECG